MSEEYLVGYGRAGDFGRVAPTPPASYRRGDRVVVEGPHGLELGVVLCTVQPGHGRFLARTAVGRLLRRSTALDEAHAQHLQLTAQKLFEQACRLVGEQSLPWQVLDVEISLDGHQARVHLLADLGHDTRRFANELSASAGLQVTLLNLATPGNTAGCDRPDCSHDTGGCSTCHSDSGCSTCGKSIRPDQLADLLRFPPTTTDRPVRTRLL